MSVEEGEHETVDLEWGGAVPGGGCGGEGNVCVRGEAWPVVAPLAPGCPARRGHPAPGYLAALQLYLGAVASAGRSAALSVGCAPRRRSRLSSRHVRPQGGDVAPLSLVSFFSRFPPLYPHLAFRF